MIVPHLGTGRVQVPVPGTVPSFCTCTLPTNKWESAFKWENFLKIAKIFKTIRFTPLEIRDNITDISD